VTGLRAEVVVASNRAAAGVYEDETGPLIVAFLERLGFVVDPPVVVPDGEPVGEAVRAAADGGARVVLTTGGTGLTPTDRTPEVTRALLDFEVPGIAEAMRAAGRTVTPLADLSRGVVGVIGHALVVNLPGSPKGALESLAAVEPVLDHALETLAGPFDHGA
jgi:molybdenum cofactor synthesis domain-containing protein